ncbi:hypothetical protein VFPPC_15429 [Pochonia chlamydosporia 170]|uniref:Uncharacterized protein n=1 Tax=Pochonia chlamydosporia 170 TaxID=1380566 RepID=A0A179G9L0_METCM|nr:hypothetical protein VFPPC_15429 [Pochonia chlamydosporia 170]OAQ74208.2 hypothetical protein VFPPC_15429 [Pochonia chlamydosporia 170]
MVKPFPTKKFLNLSRYICSAQSEAEGGSFLCNFIIKDCTQLRGWRRGCLPTTSCEQGRDKGDRRQHSWIKHIFRLNRSSPTRAMSCILENPERSDPAWSFRVTSNPPSVLVTTKKTSPF